MGPQDKLLHTCPEGEFFRDDVCMCSVGHAALIFCPDDTIPDPYNGSSCLTYDEFNFLYAHTMGPDCIEGTHDDFFLTTNSSQEYCADGEIFDEEICSCTYQAQCLMSCPPGMILIHDLLASVNGKQTSKCFMSMVLEKPAELQMQEVLVISAAQTMSVSLVFYVRVISAQSLSYPLKSTWDQKKKLQMLTEKS